MARMMEMERKLAELVDAMARGAIDVRAGTARLRILKTTLHALSAELQRVTKDAKHPASKKRTTRKKAKRT